MILVGSCKSNCWKNSFNPCSTPSSSSSFGSDMYLLPDLNKVSEYLPIIYNGHHKLVAAKLILIAAKIRKIDNLQYCLVLKNDFAKDFPYNFVISQGEYDRQKKSFAKVCICKEVEGEDTVLKFAQENKIDIKIACSNKEKGFIFFFGSQEDYKKASQINNSNILRNAIVTDSAIECVERGSTVIGFETIGLIACAYKGKKILLANKENTNSFQMMFPDTNLLK